MSLLLFTLFIKYICISSNITPKTLLDSKTLNKINTEYLQEKNNTHKFYENIAKLMYVEKQRCTGYF